MVVRSRWGLKSMAVGAALLAMTTAGTLWSQQAREGQAPRQQAQQPQQSQSRTEGSTRASLTIPSERLVELSVQAPEKVRVGDSFEYRVEVKNASDNIVLYDVKIEQETGQNFEVESARIEGGKEQQAQQRQTGERQQNQPQQREQNQQEQQKQQQQQQQQREQQEREQQEREQQERGQQEQQQQDDPSARQGQQQGGGKQQQAGSWTIKKLMPGESRTIHIKATSDKEGQSQSCLRVSSYTPALCLTTEFIKPELELVKRAPKEIHICEPFELEYFVKNTGTAAIPRITLRDPLPEGLVLTSGEEKLEFQIDGLEPDQVRKFTADVIATRAGEFATRAEAEGEGTRARSQRPSTKVVAPELAITVEGPQTVYINRLADYTIRVTNNGDAPARDARLTLRHPDDMTLVRAGEPRESHQRVSAAYRSGGAEAEDELDSNSQQGQNGAQNRQQQQDSRQQAGQRPERQQQNRPQGQRQQQQQQDARSWDLGDLAPGDTRELTVTLRSREAGQFDQQAIAEFICGADQERRDVRTRTTAFISTEVIALPALLLSVQDKPDPVAVGDEVTYLITVGNEGNAVDQNVQVEIELPEQLEFVKATGETEGKAEGAKVTFQPVKELQPGQLVKWEVRARVKSEGDAGLKATLKSEKMKEPSAAEEPTKLYKAGNQQQQSRQQPEGRENGQNKQQQEQPGQRDQ